MRSFIWLGLVALGSATTKLQDCAGECVGSAVVSTGCAPSDSQCICAADSFIENISSCIEGKCSEEDNQLDALDFAADFCSAVGGDSKEDLRKRWDAATSPASSSDALEERAWWPFGGNKDEKLVGKSRHHKKCRGHKNPFWSGSTKKCVRACKPGQFLFNRACYKHHRQCKKHKNPFWSFTSKKCVKECKKGQYLRERGCHKPYHSCRHPKRPFFDFKSKKCVHECKPNYRLRHGECHQHQHSGCTNKKRYYDSVLKKCVSHCKPHEVIKHYVCYPPHLTTTAPTTTTTATSTTATSTNTVI